MSAIPLAPIQTSSQARGPRSASPSPLDDEDEELAGMFTRKPAVDRSWRHHLHKLLESPNSSPAAFIIHFVTTFLIVFSALVTILETLPIFHSRGDRVWFGIETSLVALFTVEYVARVLAWSTSWSSFLGWFSSFFAIIDLLAILPYYIEIALQADTSAFFRFSIRAETVRTFRLLRVFRPFRYSNTLLLTIEVMFLSFKRSKDVLLALAFFLVTTLVIFSTLIYFAERGVWDDALSTFVDSDGEPSQIESIPAAAWFVLVTITTVGYGDVTPRSFLGRIVTVPLLLSGLLLIALPSFVLGREFASIWESVSHNQREGGHDPMLSPIIFSANPDVVNRPRRLHRPSAEASSRQSEDARAAAEQMAVLSKDVQRLQTLVEKQSSDMAHLMAIVRNMASQDKAQ